MYFSTNRLRKYIFENVMITWIARFLCNIKLAYLSLVQCILSPSSTNLQAICGSNFLINSLASLVSLYAWLFLCFFHFCAFITVLHQSYVVFRLAGKIKKALGWVSSRWSWVADRIAFWATSERNKKSLIEIQIKLSHITFHAD